MKNSVDSLMSELKLSGYPKLGKMDMELLHSLMMNFTMPIYSVSVSSDGL